MVASRIGVFVLVSKDLKLKKIDLLQECFQDKLTFYHQFFRMLRRVFRSAKCSGSLKDNQNLIQYPNHNFK